MSHSDVVLWDDADAEEFDSGANIRDKADLIKTAFLIGKITFRKGDFGPYVTVTAVDRMNSEFVFNDGSTGIYRQLVNWCHERKLLDAKVTNPDSQEYDVRIKCLKGLRVSSYESPNGPAKTYYLA